MTRTRVLKRTRGASKMRVNHLVQEGLSLLHIDSNAMRPGKIISLTYAVVSFRFPDAYPPTIDLTPT